jgi:putative lipoprotein
VRVHRSVAIPLLIAALTCASATAWAQDDPWFGDDKALHFSVSAAIAAGGYGVSVPFTEARWQRALFGGSLAIAAGAGKEAYDATGAGSPSYKDFTWDVIGAATGVGLALLIDWALAAPPARAPDPSPTPDAARNAAERGARLWLVVE